MSGIHTGRFTEPNVPGIPRALGYPSSAGQTSVRSRKGLNDTSTPFIREQLIHVQPKVKPSGRASKDVPSATQERSVIVYVGFTVLKIGMTLMPISGSPMER